MNWFEAVVTYAANKSWWQRWKMLNKKLCQGNYAIQTLLKICHIYSLKPVTENKLCQGQLPWGQKSSSKLVEQNGCHTHLCGLCVDDAECHMCSWQKAGDNMLVTESKICARRDSCPAEPSELSENSHIISWQEADDKNSKGRQLSCVSSDQRIG